MKLKPFKPVLTGFWNAVLITALIVIVVVPLLNLYTAKDSLFHVPDYMIPLLGKFLCFAIVALVMDMIWGYTGILSLGHGVFFALGGYVMGMYLMRNMAGQGVYKSQLPDFMVFLDMKELPWYWLGFDSFPFTLLMIVLVPGLFAFVFGYLSFRSRIKGVYFSIITQAMTYAFMLAFFQNDLGFGGNNGLTDFKQVLNFSLQEHSTKIGLYVITATVLLICFLLSRFIIKSRLGKVLMAIRDAEERVRFSGYDPLSFKLFIWVFSAVFAGIAGALYVPQVGIINPSEMHPANSIEMAIWVAVGGRGTLIGPLIGTLLVNGAKSIFTVVYPDAWLYFLGGLYIVVTLFMPQGIYGLLTMKHAKRFKLLPKLALTQIHTTVTFIISKAIKKE